MTVNVADKIGIICTSRDDASELAKYLSHHPASIDFSGVKCVTSLFLCRLIHELNRVYPLDIIEHQMRCVGLDMTGNNLLQEVFRLFRMQADTPMDSMISNFNNFLLEN